MSSEFMMSYVAGFWESNPLVKTSEQSNLASLLYLMVSLLYIQLVTAASSCHPGVVVVLTTAKPELGKF
jgi:hypothetical protein